MMSQELEKNIPVSVIDTTNLTQDTTQKDAALENRKERARQARLKNLEKGRQELQAKKMRDSISSQILDQLSFLSKNKTRDDIMTNSPQQVSSTETMSSRGPTLNSAEQLEHEVARAGEKNSLATRIVKNGKSLISAFSYCILCAAAYTLGTLVMGELPSLFRGVSTLSNDPGNSKKHEQRELSTRGDLFNGQSILH